MSKLEVIKSFKRSQKYYENKEAMGALVIPLVFYSAKSKEITKLIPFKEQELNIK